MSARIENYSVLPPLSRQSQYLRDVLELSALPFAPARQSEQRERYLNRHILQLGE
jgi:hypothetical protein